MIYFFQYEAYIHCDVPWAREGSGFTLLFEAFIMTMSRNMPVNTLANIINEYRGRIWRVIDHYVAKAYESVDFYSVSDIGIDETFSKRAHNYITLFVDLDKSKVIFATEGKDASTVKTFKTTFEKHNG